MPGVFLVSDTHFGHAGVCRFLCDDGVTKIRPWTDPEEMDEELVKRWNETVGKNDKVYHLGDVVINRRCLRTLNRLNGDKVLIKGNHDIFKLEDYTPYFRDIRGYHVMNNIILSHIPIHPDGLYRFRANIHGHTHQRRVMRQVYNDSWDLEPRIDPRYFNVSVECIDFRPMLFEEVLKRIDEQLNIGL